MLKNVLSEVLQLNLKFTASIGLTPEQVEIQNVAREFAKKEMLPNMAEWDEKVRAKHAQYSFFGCGLFPNAWSVLILLILLPISGVPALGGAS